ncbi:rhomboid family intramembrane serine protease [Flavobacterium psychrophilum]|nr:rhomboid family intramembrane serine protease [Flavobacterium psychrophilum]GAW88787.1 rhomboid family intramembrane serine protease [Flavobacterium psychrophilum]
MMNNMTPTVKQLLIINIIFFLGSIVVPNAEHLLALYYFENPSFKIWQPVTHMFMHGGLMHIAFNMFALVSFGSLLENIWGGKKFLFFIFHAD